MFLQSISLFFEAFERIFHRALFFPASHSTFLSKLCRKGRTDDVHTDGGSTKSPLGNGSLMKTVYDGSELDIVDAVDSQWRGVVCAFFIGAVELR